MADQQVYLPTWDEPRAALINVGDEGFRFVAQLYSSTTQQVVVKYPPIRAVIQKLLNAAAASILKSSTDSDWWRDRYAQIS